MAGPWQSRRWVLHAAIPVGWIEAILLRWSPFDHVPIRQEHSPSLSADANHVAYVRAERGVGGLREPASIFVRQIGEARDLPITFDPLPKGPPVWSPDGRWIAFVRYSPGQAGIWLIPALGGAERKVGSEFAR